MLAIIDKPTIDLLCILFAGAGVFPVLTKYSVPQLNSTFWGHNPYTIKRDKIEGVLSVVFSVLASLGLVLQAGAITFSPHIAERSFSSCAYAAIFVLGALLMVPFVSLLAKLGRAIAKRMWLPEIIKSQRDSFRVAKQVVASGGLRNEEDSVALRKQGILEDRKSANLANAEKSIAQIENLLEVSRESDELGKRIARLKGLFEKNS